MYPNQHQNSGPRSYEQRYAQAQSRGVGGNATPLQVNEFMSRVFGWLAMGLGVAGVVSFGAAQVPAILQFMLRNSWVFIGIFVVELIMISTIFTKIQSMSFGAAAGAYLVFTTLTGLALTPIFVIYTGGSIAATFLTTAATFGFMFVWGWTTKKDLSGFAAFLMPAVIGIVVGSVINMIWANETMYWIITYLGIPLFAAVAMWKGNQIRKWAGTANSREGQEKLAVLGALTLFVTFINLFQLLLRVLGGRR